MRLIDADELMEHVYRDKLDSRELIAQMIENAQTIEPIYRVGKELALKVPAKVTGYSETEEGAAIEVCISVGMIRTKVTLRPEELEKYVVCVAPAGLSIMAKDE